MQNSFACHNFNCNFDKDKPISAQIYTLLKDAIIDCTLMPNSTLSENEVAKYFKISRQPVREAFIKLSSNGFVEVAPKKTTKVKGISKKDVIQGLIIRRAIETAIMEVACKCITDEDIQRLEDCLLEQEKASLVFDLPRHFAFDDNFHKIIVLSAKYDKAWEILTDLKDCIDRVRYLTIGTGTFPLMSTYIEHKAIIEALKSRDCQKAIQAIEDHLNSISKSLISIMDQSNQNYFID